jgi:hypothetical protein
MSTHLAKIGKWVSAGAHAVLPAGIRRESALNVPDNASLLRLPPYAPELNPIEDVWGYLRGNQLSKRAFLQCRELDLNQCSGLSSPSLSDQSFDQSELTVLYGKMEAQNGNTSVTAHKLMVPTRGGCRSYFAYGLCPEPAAAATGRVEPAASGTRSERCLVYCLVRHQ